MSSQFIITLLYPGQTAEKKPKEKEVRESNLKRANELLVQQPQHESDCGVAGRSIDKKP